MATTTLKMKLLIDTKKNQVLFAEANKDVVDFLFSLLALPMATIVGMLGGKEYMSGSVGNLYASVQDIDHEYILPGAEKRALLWPKVVPSAASTSRSPFPQPAAPSCPRCCYNMSTRDQYIIGYESPLQAAYSSNGFVQAAVTYTVKDDLTVTPMSNISSIMLFSTFGVTSFSGLQERTVCLGYVEGMQILQASLRSKTVLTDVFLR